MQFFHEIDQTDKAAPFIRRHEKLPLLQSHGWIDGYILDETFDEVVERYCKKKPATWPLIGPSETLVIVDRYGRKVEMAPARIPLHRIRQPSTTSPLLSVIVARWGGTTRVGESSEPADDGEGGWGKLGCPPSDWYQLLFQHRLLSRGNSPSTAPAIGISTRWCGRASCAIRSSGAPAAQNVLQTSRPSGLLTNHRRRPSLIF